MNNATYSSLADALSGLSGTVNTHGNLGVSAGVGFHW